jgi:Skp family chaperone for outer membrane proteins
VSLLSPVKVERYDATGRGRSRMQMRSMRHAGIVAAPLAALLLSACGRNPGEIAVIDVDAVFKGYKKSQAIYAMLDKEKRDFETKGQGMLDEINALVKESGILSEQARSERETRIKEKSAALDLYRRTATRDLVDRTNEEYQKLMVEVRAASEAVARKRGVRAVIDASSVAYSEKGMDVTRELVEELNRRFEKAGGK